MENENQEPQQQVVHSPIRQILTRSHLIEACLILIIAFIAFSALYLFTSNKKVPPSTSSQLPQMWRIAFSLNTTTHKLSVKSMTVTRGVAIKSNLKFSRYKLVVYGANKKELYEDTIPIAEFVDFQYAEKSNATPAPIPSLPPTIDSLVAIPYFDQAVEMEVYKDNTSILLITPVKSKLSSLHLINQAYADTNTCQKLHIVYLQDGYTDMNQYHQDVATITNALLSTDPYSSAPDMFDFKTIDNSSSFGCSQNGVFNAFCLMDSTSQQNALNAVLAQYPDLPQNRDYLKVIIIANATVANGQGIAGITFGLGSPFGVFQNHINLENVSVHEIGGHAIGYLYDRYILGSYNPEVETPANSATGVKSNCTDNSNGEAFWQQARASSQNAYPGCIYSNFYAPDPRDCSDPDWGTSQSVMSASTTCTQNIHSFDAVEAYWIKNDIISHYLSCPTDTPTPTATDTPTQTPTPTLTPTEPPAGTVLTSTPTTTISGSSSPSPSLSLPGGAAGSDQSTVDSSSETNTEPLVFYTCHQVDTTQVVNGKPLQISQLKCDPVSQ